MKNQKSFSLTIISIVCLIFTYVHSASAQFSNLYGNALDQHFTHVIPDGQEYYVLGQEGTEATIARILSNGSTSWVRKLTMPSGLLDGIVMPNGQLLFVGLTLQFPNQSIIGQIDRNNSIVCLKTVDGTGSEGISRIVSINANTYLAVGWQTALTPKDIVVMKISTSGSGCIVVQKFQFQNAPGADYGNDIVVTGANSFMVAGKDGSNSAVILQYDLNGNQLGGVQGPVQYSYIDIVQSGSDIICAANSTSGGRPHIIRFDSNLLPIWESEIFGINSITQILVDANDKIYVVGTASTLSERVIIKLDDCNGTCSPFSDWLGNKARYLNDGATTYIGGYLATTASNQLAFAAGQEGTAGFGMEDGFLAVTDDQLTSMACREEHQIDLNTISSLFNGPVGDLLLPYDLPPATMVDAPLIMWGATATCITIPVDTCICSVPEMILLHDGTEYNLSCLPHGSSTPVLNCPTGTVSISGFYGCVDANSGEPCETDTPVNWILTGPNGPLDGGATTNYPAFIFPPSYFQTNGTYHLTLSTLCNGEQDSCICTLDWIVTCDTCCTNEEDFLAAASLVQVDFTIGDCALAVKASGMTECMQISYAWGDGQIDGPVGANNVPITHTYLTGSTYSFCYTIEEVNNGEICWSYTHCDTIIMPCSATIMPGCGWTVSTYYGVYPTSTVGAVYDTRYNSNAIPGTDWGATSPVVSKFIPTDWTKNIIGDVFGIALDNNGKIYLAATDVYNFDAGLTCIFGNAGPAGIYMTDLSVPGYPTSIIVGTINQSTLIPVTGSNLPSTGTANSRGNSLGNIAYDHIHNKLFVTNMEDGRIYRIDPVTHQVLSAYDPFALDNGQAGIAPAGERLWGIRIANNRVYFSREQKFGSAPNPKQIWSIGLDINGEFAANSTGNNLFTGAPQIEINNGPGTQAKYTDIAFSQNGNRMLIAERGDPHGANIFEFQNSLNWIPGNSFAVGDHLYGTNSAGGVDYGYREQNGNPKANCDGLIWASANCLDPIAIPSNWCQVYGLAGIAASGNTYPANSSTDLYIDYDGVYNTNPKFQIGDVELFKCGCSQPGVCDSIHITSMSFNGPQDTCCFKLTVDNDKPNYFTAIQICASNGVSISNVSVLNGWCLQSYSALEATVLPPGCIPNKIPNGTQDFIKFCLSNYQVTTNQQIIVKYYGPDYKVICMDTLNYACSQKPKCLKVTSTAECAADGKYKMNFCIMSNAQIGFNVGSFELNPPPGVTFTPNVFTPNPSPLLPGQMQCNFMTVVSGAVVDGQTICYTVTAHKGNITTVPPPSDPTPCCTDTVMKACVTLPDCICNKISANTMSVNMPGSDCCWKVNLTNNYSNSFFTGVQLCILSGGVTFGSISNPGFQWNLNSSPTMATFSKLPAGTFLGATENLPTFCLAGVTTSTQIVLLKWLGSSGKIVCEDTLKFNCIPPVEKDCAVLVSPQITCDPNSAYTYNLSFHIQNNSGFTINQVVLSNSIPPIFPNTFSLTPSLPNGQTSPQVLTTQISGMLPGQQFCFYLTVNDIGPNGNELNCCTHSQQYCFIVPNCPCDTAISATGLTGYFPFNGNAQDLSPTGIAGFVNGPSLVTGHDNATNSAYHFNGISDGIDITTDNRYISNEVTIVAFVKTSELQFGQWIAGKYSFAEDKGYGLSIGTNLHTNIGFVAFGGRDGTSTYHSSGFSSVKVNDGNWHCIVGTAGNNLWKVYVDGALASSTAGSTNNLATSLNERFTIGYHTDPNTPLWMDGDIDNVMIYNRALADDEIECLCSGTLPAIEYCDCGTDNTSIPNQIANGSFESGYSGFTTSLTPNNPCGWGSYVIANNANSKCGSWPSFNDHTTGSGNFMVIDGNPTFAGDIWSEPVNVIPGMTYCFSFWTASIYAKSQQDFDLDVVILGNDGFNSTSNLIGTSTVSEVFLPGQITPTWIKHTLIWTCPNNFYGPYTIIINQATSAFGDDYADFGIDDICFTKFTKPDSCCVNIDYFNSLVAQGFTVTQNGCSVTVCSPQFDSCHYFGMEPTFGDGIPVPAVVVPANGCWTHVYAQSGSYTICATVYEDTCWSKVMCTTVNVFCDPSGCTCPSNSLVSNPSFEFGPSGFPNGQNQIGQCTDWFSSNGGVTSIGDWFSYPSPYFPGFYLDTYQGPLELRPHCGSKYAGIDLSTCEGISTALITPIPAGNTYTVGFYWSISQPVISPFNFHAIMSGGNCNVNLTGGNTCTHTCGGDFHIVVPVNSSHIPGVWYYHTQTGIVNYPPAINNITFAGMLGQQAIDNYLFIDDLCVSSTPPDLCECRDADNLVLADGNNQIPTVPYNAVPISLSCDSTGNGIFTLFGEPHCAGDSCLGSDFSWVITDSSGFIVRLGSQPITGYTPGSNSGFFALQAPKNAFTPGVVYTITITTYCGTKACPFSVQFIIDCDSCSCGTFGELNWRPSQGAPNQSIVCGDSLVIGCPAPGYNVTFGGLFFCVGDTCPNSYVKWTLRKSGTNQVLTGGTELFNPFFTVSVPGVFFSNTGVYELTLTGICNGKECESCKFTITAQGCPCMCDKFEKLKVVNKKLGFSQNLTCDNDPRISISCPPPGKPYKLTGRLNCTPANCQGSNIHWELKQGNNSVDSGNQSGPWFSITLDNNVLAGLTGLYDLVLTGVCGNDTCTCILHFQISGCPITPVCPCDNQFYTNVTLGFSYGWDYDQTGCSWKFTPSVNECDSVFWEIQSPNGFTVMGSTMSNQSFSATFPNGTLDTYKVTMKVHRPGTNCWMTYCSYVTLNCIIVGVSGICESNEIENSGFNEKSIAGILGHGGTTQGWTSRSGSPELIDGSGCGDPFSIQLAGKCAKEYVDIIDYSVELLHGKNGFNFSACYKAFPGNLKPGTVLVLRLSDIPQESAECSGLCMEVARIPLDEHILENWNSISSSFLLNVDNMCCRKWLTIHIENDLTDDELDANSIVQLDNICFEQNDRTTVPTFDINKEEGHIRIYPNPNDGEFIVELPEPAMDGTSIRIIGLTGQILFDKRNITGKALQSVKTSQLPDGMYFVQVLSEGHVLYINKFVKQ